MTEKRQRNGPTGTVRTPRCEVEYPPPPGSVLRTRFITQDHVIYEVCDDCVTPSLVMNKAVHSARRESSAAPLRVAPPPTTAPLPAAEISATTQENVHVALRDNPHVLPNVGAESFEDVLRYCYFHTAKKREKGNQAQIKADITQWDDLYVRVDPRRLCELASAAYYLDIRELVDLTCRAIAAIISGKTAEQIRTTFNIENDLVQSLTGMIQMDDPTAPPPSSRSSPSIRPRRNARNADNWEKPSLKKQGKTFSLSPIDDFANPDPEERTDAPQLGTHSVDEVEKWINGPDPAKGNGKRRKKKKKHKSSAPTQQRTAPEIVPIAMPPPPSPTPSPSVSAPPSPSLSSLADPSYVANSSCSSPSLQVKTRSRSNGHANDKERPPQNSANGFHEESIASDKASPDVITLSSDDDCVLISASVTTSTPQAEAAYKSPSLRARDENENCTSGSAKAERDPTVKSGQISRQAESQVEDAKEANGRETHARRTGPSPDRRAGDRPPRGSSVSPTRQTRKTRECSSESGDTSVEFISHPGMPRTGGEVEQIDHSAPVDSRGNTEIDHNGSKTAADEPPPSSDSRREPASGALDRPKPSSGAGPARLQPLPNGTSASLDDGGPSFILCPDDMDKEVEDFANRLLNGSDPPTESEVGLTGNKVSSLHSDDHSRREERRLAAAPPVRMPEASGTEQGVRERSRSAVPNVSYEAGLRLMEKRLERARREAQLLERKRHCEERAAAVEKQIADLISDREKVRDELSLVRIQLMQLEKERSPRRGG